MVAGRFRLLIFGFLVLAGSARVTFAQQLSDLLRQSQGGDARAQTYLAESLRGFGAQADFAEATRWACEGAWQGSIRAQLLLSELLAHKIVQQYDRTRLPATDGVSPLPSVDSNGTMSLPLDADDSDGRYILASRPWNVNPVGVDALTALAWVTRASYRMPKLDVAKLKRKAFKQLIAEGLSYVYATDSTGTPLEVITSRAVQVLTKALELEINYKAVAAVEERERSWQPTHVQPWVPNPDCAKRVP